MVQGIAAVLLILGVCVTAQITLPRRKDRSGRRSERALDKYNKRLDNDPAFKRQYRKSFLQGQREIDKHWREDKPVAECAALTEACNSFKPVREFHNPQLAVFWDR